MNQAVNKLLKLGLGKKVVYSHLFSKRTKLESKFRIDY